MLSEAASCVSEDAIRTQLSRLPEIELSYFFEHFERFRSTASEPPSSQPAASLWPETARLAVVEPWFRIAAPARVFVRWEPEETARFAPEALAAPVETIARILEDPPPSFARNLFALVALTGVGAPIAGDELRSRVWRVLGVPLHVQLRGFHGELLASECVSREGLHTAIDSAWIEPRPSGELAATSLANLRFPVLRLATRLEATINRELCPCGRPGPRLENLRLHSPRALESLHALAAAVGAAPAPGRENAPRMLS
jgi:hypothetical protein